MSWPLVSVGDLFVVHYGRSLKKEERDETGSHLVYGSSGCIGSHNDSVFDDETIVIGRKGSVGEVIWAPKGGWVIDTAFYLERKKRERIDLRYSYYALKKANLASRTITTSIPGLNRDDLYQTKIPLPPLEEQKRIAAILDKAEAIRRKRQQAIKLADDFLRSVFLEMFGDPVTNPKGWEVDLLKNQILSANNGLSRRSAAEENFGDIVLRLQDVHYDGIRYDKKLSRIPLDESEKRRYLLHEGDLLFIRVNGNPDYVGRSAVFSGYGEHIYHNDHLIRLKVGKNYNSEFLSFAFNSKGGRKLISKYIKTSAGQHTISQDGIERIAFYIPPIHLQNKFVSLKNKVLSIPYDVEFSENLSASLSQKAFSGMI